MTIYSFKRYRLHMKCEIELNPNNQNIISFLLHATCSCRNLWILHPRKEPKLLIRVDILPRLDVRLQYLLLKMRQNLWADILLS